MKNVFIYLSIFIIIGELMIRFDESFAVLEKSRVVKITTDIEITHEYQLLKNDNFTFSEIDLRIMVIGDSYIHGGGIDFENNFSQQLKKMLNTKKLNYDEIWVLDVSKPSSNNLDNNNTYFQFANKFKPNIVILGYNINDINGNLDKSIQTSSDSIDFKNTKASSKQSQRLIKKIYNFIYNSSLVHYILYNSHRKLNTYGIIVPNSNFDVVLKSYYQNRENWQKSKVLLKEIINDTNKNNIQLIVYKFPEIHLLDYPQLFSKANESIKSFFESYPSVIYMNGSDVFREEKSEEYILSKYNGHPNEKAHYKMAKDVFNIIDKQHSIYNNVYDN